MHFHIGLKVIRVGQTKHQITFSVLLFPRWNLHELTRRILENIDHTISQMRLGTACDGPAFLFWRQDQLQARISTDETLTHKFGEKMLSGFFNGCALDAGAGWTTDLLIADRTDTEMADSQRRKYTCKDSNPQQFSLIKAQSHFLFLVRTDF